MEPPLQTSGSKRQTHHERREESYSIQVYVHLRMISRQHQDQYIMLLFWYWYNNDIVLSSSLEVRHTNCSWKHSFSFTTSITSSLVMSLFSALLHCLFPSDWSSAVRTKVNIFQSTCQRKRPNWQQDRRNSDRKKMRRLKSINPSVSRFIVDSRRFVWQ